MAADELEKAANVTKGQVLTVRGTILGVPGFQNIVVKPCTVLDGPAATAKPTQMPPAVTVHLWEMLRAYDSNEVAAEQKYTGKVVEI